MAEQAGPNWALQWGKTPDGHFQITVGIPMPPLPGRPAGTVTMTIVRLFVLSKEEEASLKASLGGITVATELPETLLIHPNGHK